MSVAYLKGKRIKLCVWESTEEVKSKFLRWVNDDMFRRFIGRAKVVTTKETVEEWIESRINVANSYYFLINVDEDIIGYCSISVNGSNGILGITIGEHKYQNNGYGCDVINTLLWYAFNDLGLHSVRLKVDASNTKAIECYKKCGFINCGVEHEVEWYEGKWNDCITMEILSNWYL